MNYIVSARQMGVLCPPVRRVAFALWMVSTGTAPQEAPILKAQIEREAGVP